MATEETTRERRSLLVKRESALQKVTAGLSVAATRDEILRAILDEGGHELATSAAVAFVKVGDGKTLRLVAQRGLTPAIERAVAEVSLESAFPVARAVRDGRALWVTSREALAHDFPDFERAASDAFERQALVALPLRVRGAVVGGIGFAFPKAHPFDKGERAFLTTLATRCESAMERASLYEESQEARLASERRRVETEALLRFSELVSGILAHDLRNPLAAVLTNARLLRAAPGEREREIGARVVASGERMTRMIDQILDWTRARSQAGHVRVARGPCDLGVVAEEVVGELRARGSGAPISVETRGSLRGHWDADRLAQALSNLVGNGIDHATRPGVRLLLDGRGEDVHVVVENDGRIDDELLPLIFEPFRGRGAGAASRGRGLGLGLYITRQIVLAHGGRIGVTCLPEGRVRFTVTLPRG
jgi:signal transduction histidine kinase